MCPFLAAPNLTIHNSPAIRTLRYCKRRFLLGIETGEPLVPCMFVLSSHTLETGHSSLLCIDCSSWTWLYNPLLCISHIIIYRKITLSPLQSSVSYYQAVIHSSFPITYLPLHCVLQFLCGCGYCSFVPLFLVPSVPSVHA